jgi:hypothetical protein
MHEPDFRLQVKAALNQQAQSLNEDAARVKSTEKLLKKIARQMEKVLCMHAYLLAV